MMKRFVISLQDANRTTHTLTGGKGANLGELSRISGIVVPPAFCVTTRAYDTIIAGDKNLSLLIDSLNKLSSDDRRTIAAISSEIRAIIEQIAMPDEIENEITEQLASSGENTPVAVRSSATAEDLPDASFAGQQDSYLNIKGKTSLLEHISKCWASLFTDRAVIYRIQNGYDHAKVQLAVIVQKMIFPHASGIMFTADPISGNRKIVSIDAGFGLGEAMVAGLVNADNYKIKKGRIIEKTIRQKKLAVYGSVDGGTKEETLENALQSKQVLSPAELRQLEQTARKIGTHFGSPQDIEWCLANKQLYIVQSRPITTLYPIPEESDNENHIYISVGHNQMMTDAMKPLGLSFFQATTMAKKAGGRLYMDITKQFSFRESRKKLIETSGQNDRLLQDALRTLEKRRNFIKPPTDLKPPPVISLDKKLSWSFLSAFENNLSIVPDLIKQSEASVAELKQAMLTKSGTDVLDLIQTDIANLKQILFKPESFEAMKIGWYASAWLNKNIERWLGEKNIAGVLSQSSPHNITAEMGLQLLDIADAIRPYPELINYLQKTKDENFTDQLHQFPGGSEAKKVITAYLNKYGMRCAGEIDITKTRWAERPSILLPAILTNLRNFESGEHQRRFEQGRIEAHNKEQELLDRLMLLPGGKRKASDTKRMIALLRRFVGYREYPKYGIINRYFVYKQALLREAFKLVESGVLHAQEDIFYLDLTELRDAIKHQQADISLINNRKEKFRIFSKLTPPRVITSDGEIITGRYNRENIPTNALVGLAASSGTVEGRARVILNMEDASLEEGDILVTSFTDPSWTPLFVSIKGLVTEVGGLMTHGSVIAREYGLPAVVGVEHACTSIKDGQKIRVNGTEGFIEIL